MISIEDLRSQESHADANFIELQELRKIHKEMLARLDIVEKNISEKDQIIISLRNELAKYTNAADCQQTGDAIQRSSHQDQCGQTLRYDDCSIQDG